MGFKWDPRPRPVPRHRQPREVPWWPLVAVLAIIALSGTT